VPVGFVSGEEIAVKQAIQALPWAKSVVVDKRKEAYTSGQTSIKYLIEGRNRLRETAAIAVGDAPSMKPLVLPGPLHFEATFRNTGLANRFNTWGFKQKGALVEWDAENMIQGFNKFNKLTFFSKKVYPFRRPMTSLMRSFFRIKNTYFAPKPNPEGAISMATADNSPPL
jgi:D-amino peptidase